MSGQSRSKGPPPGGRLIPVEDWIGYRRSRAEVDRRADRGDVAVVCVGCGCEADISPVPHSPRCGEGEA